MTSIHIINQQKDLPLSSKAIKQLIEAVLSDLKIQTSEVTFHFVTEERIAQVHKQIFDDPSVTDCITIPIDPLTDTPTEDHILGEAFICPKTAINYSQKHSLNPHHELSRYVIHCLLHFAGFTDHTSQEQQRMRRKETAYLKKFL